VSTEQQYCTFHLDGHFFGIDVLQVQEVLRFQELARVPLAHKVISGLINLRGQIVTAIDMRARLQFAEREDDTPPMNVIIRTDDGPVSLLVDQIGDVLEVSEDDFERRPDTVKGVARELITGAYKLEDKLLLVLDTEKAIDILGPKGSDIKADSGE
jgi:purine-binding chemotaxis protein CheW